MERITLWYKFNNKSSTWKYNHYEKGWDRDILPYLLQPYKEPPKERWSSECAFMDGTIVKHMDDL